MNGRRNCNPVADEELWSLVDALVEGAATPEGRDRLESRLRADERARLFYVAYLDLHAHLQWTTRGQSVQPSDMRAQRRLLAKKVADLASRRAATGGAFGSLLKRRSRWVAAASLLIAAGLLTGLMFYPRATEEGESPELPDAPPGSVAVLIDSGSTVWDKDMVLPTETGSALSPGRLKLRSGVAEVAFADGGAVLLEGPADFDVSAADSGFLHWGKLTAKVPEGAPAFRVSTPGLLVTDRGGEYGLLRDESGVTEVHVFGGAVGADQTDNQGDPLAPIGLTANAGVRLDVANHTTTRVPLNEEAFARLRPDVRVIDASVRGGYHAGRNFGTAAELVVKNSIPDYTWEGYLRFDLSGVKGPIQEARVRLMPIRIGDATDNAVAFVQDNQWSETSLTWLTRPFSGAEVARWTPVKGQAVEFDVTRLVQEALSGDKRLSLRLFAPHRKRGNSCVEYGSRRGEPQSRPQLVITTVH
jgi:hypothetical protein